MDGFDFTPAADDTSEVVGDTYSPTDEAAPVGCVDEGGAWTDTSTCTVVTGYLEGVNIDMDGRTDALALDADSDGVLDLLVTNNGDSAYEVEVDIDGDGTLDTSTTVDVATLQDVSPELWAIIDVHHSDGQGSAADVHSQETPRRCLGVSWAVRAGRPCPGGILVAARNRQDGRRWSTSTSTST